MRVIGIIALMLGAATSALIWTAARSDFRFRGCPDLPRAEWSDTVNCSDGWLAMVLSGAVALALLALAGWIFGRGHA